MKFQLLSLIFAIHFVALFSVIFVNCEEVNNEKTSTTTEGTVVDSLQGIIRRIKSMKERTEKILNETAKIDATGKSRHDIFVGNGYRFTAGIGYHRLYLTKLTWYDALHFCRKEYAHLAVIDTSAEGSALGEIVKERMVSVEGAEIIAYVGIHDYCKNGSWISIFFDILDNTKHIIWQQGSPNYDETSSRPNCAAIDKDGKLTSLKCSGKQAFICEAEL